jgi:hypothetical protein
MMRIVKRFPLHRFGCIHRTRFIVDFEGGGRQAFGGINARSNTIGLGYDSPRMKNAAAELPGRGVEHVSIDLTA